MTFSPALPLFGVEASLEVDASAAGVSFSEYCQQQSALGDSDAIPSLRFVISTRPNQWVGREDKYGVWDISIDCGRSYLVGMDVPLASFLSTHTRDLRPWQRVSFRWALANPDQCLQLETFDRGLYWTVEKRGEYVEFGLPHQTQGGEKHWISRDGQTRVLVNVD
jgi:hypothetical protein